MNDTFYATDRATHLKVVVIALIASICVAVFGIAARVSGIEEAQTASNTTPPVVAGQPVVISNSDRSVVR